MVFPRATEEFVWDGRSTTGFATAELWIDRDRLRLGLSPFWRRIIRAPEIEIPFVDVRRVERMLFRGIVIRTSSRLTDGTSFTPTSISTASLIGERMARGLRVVPTTAREQTGWRLHHLRSNLFPQGWKFR